jgi:hypothetical protein
MNLNLQNFHNFHFFHQFQSSGSTIKFKGFMAVYMSVEDEIEKDNKK